MNLQEFVKTALLEIIEGVAEAREPASKLGAMIGSNAVYGQVDQAKVITDEQGRTVSLIEFDVVLTQGAGTSTKGGIGVLLGAVGLGSQGASHDEASSNSRIRFSVPVVFPGDGAKPDHSDRRVISRGQY